MDLADKGTPDGDHSDGGDNGVYPSPSLLRPPPTKLKARDKIPSPAYKIFPVVKMERRSSISKGGKREKKRDSKGFLKGRPGWSLQAILLC